MKKEFLTEETYEKGKKKITRIALIKLIIGLLIGIALIITGIVIQKNTKIEVSNTNGVTLSYIKYIFLYIIGAIIIIASLGEAKDTYLFLKKREIEAFLTQQTMPIRKEKMEKMASSVGIMGKEISKGIKEGLDKNK